MMDEHVKEYYAEKVAHELNPPPPPPPPSDLIFTRMAVKWGLDLAKHSDWSVVFMANCT